MAMGRSQKKSWREGEKEREKTSNIIKMVEEEENKIKKNKVREPSLVEIKEGKKKFLCIVDLKTKNQN